MTINSIILAEDDDDIANIMTDHFKIAKFRIYKTKRQRNS